MKKITQKSIHYTKKHTLHKKTFITQKNIHHTKKPTQKNQNYTKKPTLHKKTYITQKNLHYTKNPTLHKKTYITQKKPTLQKILHYTKEAFQRAKAILLGGGEGVRQDQADFGRRAVPFRKATFAFLSSFRLGLATFCLGLPV